MNLSESFREAAQELLELPSDENARSAVHHLAGVFDDALSIQGESLEQLRKFTDTGYGTAISPYRAAECLDDYERTRFFSKGVVEAIKSAQKIFPGEEIQALYVGTGPYAALAAIAATQFEPGEVKFHFMDIHQLSLDLAQRTFERLGLSNMLAGSIKHDATKYKHPGSPFRVIFTETMREALLGEPQAAITANLGTGNALHPKGIWVPELVSVKAGLKPHWEKDIRLPLGTIINLTKHFGQAARDAVTGNLDRAKLADLLNVSVTFDTPALDVSMSLIIQTSVKVFGAISLPSRTAIITRDLRQEISHYDTPGNVRIRYALGKDNSIDLQVNHHINGTVSRVLIGTT